MKVVFTVIKVVIIFGIVYNSWLLLTTNHIQKRFMQQLSFVNYQVDLYNPIIKFISPTLNLISGWILFLVCAMQCSCIMMLITKSTVPYTTTMLGLCIEGSLYILMGEAGRMKEGVQNPGWTLLVAGLSVFALREREQSIRQETLKK